MTILVKDKNIRMFSDFQASNFIGHPGNCTGKSKAGNLIPDMSITNKWLSGLSWPNTVFTGRHARAKLESVTNHRRSESIMRKATSNNSGGK